jgi:hypothetical protein
MLLVVLGHTLASFQPAPRQLQPHADSTLITLDIGELTDRERNPTIVLVPPQPRAVHRFHYANPSTAILGAADGAINILHTA